MNTQYDLEWVHWAFWNLVFPAFQILGVAIASHSGNYSLLFIGGIVNLISVWWAWELFKKGEIR